MEVRTIQEYEKLERHYWWFVGRRRIIEATLQKYFSGRSLDILDWGCGPGGNFKMLKKYGEILGVDESDEALSACHKKGITNVVKAASLSEFSTSQQFDLIANFDVLEHIFEDEQFLRDMGSLLRPGGEILVTVPAYQFLWTGFDEVLGHKRRYTRKEIREKFHRAGYEVIFASYFIFFLSPAFIAYRMLQKLKGDKTTSLSGSVVMLPEPINWLFTQILILESHIISYFSFPFGTSIIVLAKKII